MAIRYKVVNKERYSIKRWSLPKDLRIKYNKGEKASAKEGTLGIMTFLTRKNAEEFSTRIRGSCRTLKVNGIGRGKRPPKELPNPFRCSLVALLNIYKYLYTLNTPWKAPKGTMCYREVEVID